MVFVTVFIIIISRANVGNWTALRVDLSSHIHHVFFSRPSDVVKTVFVIVFTSFGTLETLHVVICILPGWFIRFSSLVCVLTFLHVIWYGSSSFRRAFEILYFCAFSWLCDYNVFGNVLFIWYAHVLLILYCLGMIFMIFLNLHVFWSSW